MATEKERVSKLEFRAREAEKTLQKISSHVLLLKKKSSESARAQWNWPLNKIVFVFFAVDATFSVSM